MKHLFYFLLVATLIVGATACGGDDYDDTELKQSISKLEQRLAAAEAVINAYNQKLTITSVQTTSTGYIITFSNGTKATISNGKDGADGQNGKDGKDGDTWIQQVEVGTTEVTFTMTTGEVFVIPLASLLSSIQNLTFLPQYSDGSVAVDFTTPSDSRFELNFILSPAERTAELVEQWQSLMQVEATYTATRAAEFVGLTIRSVEADAVRGLVTLQVSASVLSPDFFAGACGAGAMLVLSDDKTTLTSDYIPLVAVPTPIPTNELWYTSYNNGVVAPKTPATLGVALSSNNYTDGKGVMTFSGELTTIGDSAFNACTALTTVTLPQSVTTIDKRAFRSCTKLTQITIPEAVTTIGDYAFGTCEAMTQVSILGRPTIGQYAFSSCKKLAAFYGPLATADHRALVVDGVLAAYAPASGNEWSVPQGVKTIGATAFANCNNLSSVVLPAGVETIATYAFYYCFALQSINIPEGVTTIGQYAFMGDRGLTALTLPASLKRLEAGAFRGCSSLKQVVLNATTPPSLYSGVFKDCSSELKIYVPASVLQEYLDHEDWSIYAAQIVAQ